MSELPAGRELDMEVAVAVWGEAGQKWFEPNNFYAWSSSGPPRFSTDIAAAWEIRNIREVFAPGHYTSHGHHPTLWHAYCGAPDDYGEDIWYDAYAETAPLAICRAALLAVSAEVSKK